MYGEYLPIIHDISFNYCQFLWDLTIKHMVIGFSSEISSDSTYCDMVRGFMEDVTNLIIDGFAQMWDAPQRCNFNGTIYALRPWIYAVLYYQTQMTQLSGWWFGTFFIFPYIGNVIIPTDEHILCMNTHHMTWILKDSIRNDGFASWSVGFSHKHEPPLTVQPGWFGFPAILFRNITDNRRNCWCDFPLQGSMRLS